MSTQLPISSVIRMRLCVDIVTARPATLPVVVALAVHLDDVLVSLSGLRGPDRRGLPRPCVSVDSALASVLAAVTVHFTHCV